MSDQAWTIVAAILSVHTTAIVALAILLSRSRERLVRTEQRLDDLKNGRTTRGTR